VDIGRRRPSATKSSDVAEPRRLTRSSRSSGLEKGAMHLIDNDTPSTSTRPWAERWRCRRVRRANSWWEGGRSVARCVHRTELNDGPGSAQVCSAHDIRGAASTFTTAPAVDPTNPTGRCDSSHRRLEVKAQLGTINHVPRCVGPLRLGGPKDSTRTCFRGSAGRLLFLGGDFLGEVARKRRFARQPGPRRHAAGKPAVSPSRSPNRSCVDRQFRDEFSR